MGTRKDTLEQQAIDLYMVKQLRRARAVLQRVDLVEYQKLRHGIGADLRQHTLDFLHLFRMVRIGGIDDMQQQVGVDGFLQGGLEGIDQPCGKARMKPTVSEIDTRCAPSPRNSWRVVVSSVANS